MLTLNNQTTGTLGPYNGLSVPASSTANVSGAVAPYISDGTLLTDILVGKVTVTFSGKESSGPTAAALLIQLGQLINTDSDGANLSRVKQAPTGWTYQLRGFEFTTSELGSLQNKDYNNSDLTDISIKFYDSSNNELSDQTSIDSGCVKTIVDIEPTYDYYLIGGTAKTLTVPSNDTRLSVVAVPDYPAPNGSKVMVQNINMRFVGSTDKVQADGRASKGLLYNSPVPHTNKIRFVVYHVAGDKVSFGVALEMYKI